MREIPEGIIHIDTNEAKELLFTSDKFNAESYLWRTGDTIIISFIISKAKGAFCQLVKRICEKGFFFEIPTPSNRMREIGKKQGWYLCKKETADLGWVEYLTNKEADNA